MPSTLPSWAAEVADLYQSHAASQFIIHGNVDDRFLLSGQDARIGGLQEFLLQSLLGRFDVVISYDLGNGIRIERGAEIFSQWPGAKTDSAMPRTPLAAIEWLTRYLRYQANLQRLQHPSPQVACIVWSAHLIAPATAGISSYELGAVASLLRDWATDDALLETPVATFLVSNNLYDLHPLLISAPRAAKVKIPLPSPEEMGRAMEALGALHPKVFQALPSQTVAEALAGSSFHSVESLIRRRNQTDQPLQAEDITNLRKRIVEEESQELIEFVPPRRNLNDLHGLDAIKTQFREDHALWASGDLDALPMGYLICGPVGTGKTFLVECLAGEAGVPVVKIRNFRDRWVGSTESNLEKIFRLLQALGRCFVFIDEADQALGRRDAQANDSGLSGRIYAMIAKEMSNPNNRGKIIWVLASSRPDLIEVDLKRPGRIDVKLPIFPTATPEEGYALLRALCGRKNVSIPSKPSPKSLELIPDLLTPGAAEALAVQIYRFTKIRKLSAQKALEEALAGYQPPVDLKTLEWQIQLAASEASQRSLVPERFR